MSPTHQGTTLVLASIAVCLMIYAMNQQYSKSQPSTLGSSMTLGGKFGDIKQKLVDWNNQRKAKNAKAVIKRMRKSKVGARRARVDPNLDCSSVSPSDPNWTRCAQGSSVGRVPTKNASSAVFSSALDFQKDSLKHQGLGTRLQDGFVNDQFARDSATNLGTSPGPGGMRIDQSNLKNNAFFSQGTENVSSSVTSGLNSVGAAAFPFSQKSGESESHGGSSYTGPVKGTEAVGMGMDIEKFKMGPVTMEPTDSSGRPMGKRESLDNAGHGTRPQRFDAKPSDEAVGNAFNPFVEQSSKTLGAGLKISEAFEPRSTGSGSTLSDAFQTGLLGSAVSPVSSNVGVSPEEIVSATATLDDVNIVQSTIGGQLNFGIRP